MGDIGGTNEGPKVTQTKRETDERREKKKRLAKWDWRRSGRVILGGRRGEMAREESYAQKSIPA